MQSLKNGTNVRISIDNKQLLAKKKRKLKVRSIDAVISLLLEKEKELSMLKKAEKRNKAKAISMEKPKPLTEEISTSFKIPLVYEVCAFKHERLDGKIDCAKDFMRTNRIHIILPEQCNECFNFHEKIPASSNKISKEHQDMIDSLF